MNVTNWNRPMRWLLTGLVALSLVADTASLPLLGMAGNSTAYARDRRDGPGPRPGGPGYGRRGPGPRHRGPGYDRRGPGPRPRGPGYGRRGPGPGPRGPGYGRRGPGPAPRGPGYGWRGPGPRPRGPGYYRRGYRGPRPYYPPPRPPHIRPPYGPGPWQRGPWVGFGPAPWWYGRPFLWSLTAAATVTAIAGITYYIIDGMYYRPYMSNGTTVYVMVPAPPPY